MSWEAYRWTAKTPSELYQTLGPHGVDELVRRMLATCWRDCPPEGRSLAAVQKVAREVFERNMGAWAKIRKPSPEAFFADLQPGEADHLMRQAMVVCWMMMPRTGGREVADVRRICGEIFDRNMAAWETDNATFTGEKKKPPVRVLKTKTGGAKSKPLPKKQGKPARRATATRK